MGRRHEPNGDDRVRNGKDEHKAGANWMCSQLCNSGTAGHKSEDAHPDPSEPRRPSATVESQTAERRENERAT
jgi:hypothetical protein